MFPSMETPQFQSKSHSRQLSSLTSFHSEMSFSLEKSYTGFLFPHGAGLYGYGNCRPGLCGEWEIYWRMTPPGLRMDVSLHTRMNPTIVSTSWMPMAAM